MRYFLSLLFSASMTGFLISPIYAQSTIGSAVSVDDTVTGNKNRVIRTASKIVANERVRANASGLAHFKFTDGTKLVVGPGTNIILDDIVYNPNGSTFKKFVLKTGAGATRFISGSSGSSAYEIKTPVGTLGIRGTSFDIQHFKGRTYVMLVNGRVEFCSLSGDCQVIRRKCDFVVADRNGDISNPKQPKDSIFKPIDMANFFPFIADQSEIKQDFRLRVKTCGLSSSSTIQNFRGRSESGGGNDSNGSSDNGSE